MPRTRSFPRLLAGVTAVILGFVAPVAAPETAAVAADNAITAPVSGEFVPSNLLTISGTKSAGSSVLVYVSPGEPDPVCSVPTSESETWECASVHMQNGQSTLVAGEFVDGEPVSESAPVSVRVLGAPTLAGPTPILTTGLVTGVAYPRADIRVIVSGATSATKDCPAALDSGYWSCALGLATGEYSMGVQQAWPGSSPPEWSNPSEARAVTVDSTPPEAPLISAPRPATRITSQPIVVQGNGENGGTIDVFIDGAPACTAGIGGGVWTCSFSDTALGARTIQAIQRDAAGNFSPPSADLRVLFVRAPTSTPAPTPTTVAPPEPAPTPSPTAVAPSPLFPPPVGGITTLAPEHTWDTPTGYGAAIPHPAEALSRGWLAALLAIAFLTLFCLPLRLLISSITGPHESTARPVHRLTGRNRSPIDQNGSTTVADRWVLAAGAAAGAATLGVLASGVQGEVRFVRLAIAVAAAVVALNIAGVVAPAKLTARALGTTAGLRLAPSLLAAGAASALLSRSFGIQPPLVVGLVLAATFAAGESPRVTARIELARTVSVAVISAVAWVAHSAVGRVEGFWPTLGSEFLAATCLAGFGAVIVLLIPLHGLPGATILHWSPVIWAVSTFVLVTVAAAVLSGPMPPIAMLLAVGSLFAAIVLAVWGWRRYVQPAA